MFAADNLLSIINPHYTKPILINKPFKSKIMKNETFNTTSVKRILITVLAIIILVTCKKQVGYGQPVFMIGAGGSSNKAFLVDLKAGYQFWKVTGSYSQKSFISAAKPAYFGLLTTYDLTENLAIGAAGYYRYQSSDNSKDFITGKKVNYFTPSINIVYKRQIWEVNACYLDKQVQLTFLMGLNFKLYYKNN